MAHLKLLSNTAFYTLVSIIVEKYEYKLSGEPRIYSVLYPVTIINIFLPSRVIRAIGNKRVDTHLYSEALERKWYISCIIELSKVSCTRSILLSIAYNRNGLQRTSWSIHIDSRVSAGLRYCFHWEFAELW